jgi:cell division septum initiation protein DivIVA
MLDTGHKCKRIYRNEQIGGTGEEMVKTNEDLAREIVELKDELRQMREIVNMLFTMIVEAEEEDEDYLPYPGSAASDNLKLNN